MTKYANKHFLILLFTVFTVILYFLPYFILGESMQIQLFDNLDSEISWFKILSQSPYFHSFSGEMPQILEGVQRVSYQSDLNFYHLLYYFPPFVAYSIHRLVSIVVAFFGAYLLSTICKVSREYALLLGLYYASLPFFPTLCLAFAIIPLVVYFGIRVYNEHKIGYVLFFAIVPFFNDFVRLGIIEVIIGFLVTIAIVIKEKKIPYRLLISICIFTLFSLVVEYRLVYEFLFPTFKSHRVEFDFAKALPAWDYIYAIKYGVKQFVVGNYYHFKTFTFIFIPLIGVFFMSKDISRNQKKWAFIALMIFFVFSIYLGLVERETLQLSLPAGLNLRWFWLNPFLMLLLLIVISKNETSRTISKLFLCTIVIAIGINFYHSESNQWIGKNDLNVSWKAFFAEEQFKEIVLQNPKIKEGRVMNIGLYPSISQYNGLNTLDGYMNNYPLKHKHNFRKIIEKELDKMPGIKSYYDNWAGTAYTFSSEIPYRQYLGIVDYSKSDTITLNKLELNWDIAKQSSVNYVLSIYPILNQEKNITFIKKYISKDSFWNIYLYKIR